MSENYAIKNRQMLHIPISVFTGEADRSVPPASAEAWAELTDTGCTLQVYPGGHFFISDHLEDMQARVAADLIELMGDD